MFNNSCIKKPKLAELLWDVFSVVERSREMVQHLKFNVEQFQSIQTTAKSTVQNKIQSEMKSHSSVPSQNPEEIFQALLEEEDMSRNVMLFLMEEERNKYLSNKAEAFVSVQLRI